MVGDFVPLPCSEGKKLAQGELSAALWERKAKPQPFERAEKEKETALGV